MRRILWWFWPQTISPQTQFWQCTSVPEKEALSSQPSVPAFLPTKMMIMIRRSQYINKLLIPSSICIVSHTSLVTVLWGKNHLYFHFCTGRNRGSKRSSNLPRIMQVQSGRTWIQTEVHQMPSPMLLAITLNFFISTLISSRLGPCLNYLQTREVQVLTVPMWKRKNMKTRLRGYFFNLSPSPYKSLNSNSIHIKASKNRNLSG